ncbi:MAG: hypothetical protein JRJ77_14470 [Deltaproteobacteria bacterium]|nr:hypothetical protein [Deltaproteobacteria bacterium]
MKPFFSQKTLLFLYPFRNKKQLKKGAVTLVCAFMVFLFTTLGLTTLMMTQLNLKLSQYRKNSVLTDYASENGIKLGFSQLSELISGIQEPVILSEQEFSSLKQDALNNGEQSIELLLSSEIPLTTSGEWEYMKWSCLTSFTKTCVKDFSAYFISEYKVDLKSQGKVYEYRTSRIKTLSCFLTLFTGNIPLSALPLLKDKNTNHTPEKEFLEKNNISVFSSGEDGSAPKIYLSEDELIPDTASEQIREALNIKIFKPQDLSDQKLRQILGLEITDEPVPGGVYLIKDDLGLGGIFIQGDVEEMILALEQDYQIIKITHEAGVWILKFNPQTNETCFITPLETQYFDLTPKGIVIVNGGIKSLGGGFANSSGEIEMLGQEEQVPSVLNSVNLTIISSEEITISDHIIHEGVQWIESVPYVKDSQSQLNIFAGGNSLAGQEERTGGITIENNASEELKIQASLTTSKGEFSIIGENKTVSIFGSVHASEYSISQNELNITEDDRYLNNENLLKNSPLIKIPLLHLADLEIREWKENE